MKKHFRGVSLAAMLLTASTTVTAADGIATVGDLPGYGEEAYFAEESEYAQHGTPAAAAERATAAEASTAGGFNQPGHSPAAGTHRVGDLGTGSGTHSRAGDRDLRTVSYGVHLDSSMPELAAADGEITAGESLEGSYVDMNGIMAEGVHPGGYEGVHPGFYEGISGSCDMACDGGITTRLDKHRTGWAQAELLLWFPQARQLPALITTAPSGGLPQLNLAGTDVAFGGEVGNDLAPGFRIDAGRYVSDNIGLGGRFWILGQDSENASLSGNGSERSIGRPFFNTDVQSEDAILIALDNNFTGSVVAESSLELWAAEAYGRINFFRGSGFRTDFIGGYTHFDIEDHLFIASRTIEVNPATGETTTFRDSFDTENRFNGGQLGFETELNRGRWMFKTLTKVHLGNMNQQVNIHGSSTVVTPPAAPVTTSGGALALDNQGSLERDSFAFAPEANVKLAYRFRPNVLLSVGYSFIYWDDVALAGDFVNPVLAGSSLGTAGPFGQPALSFKDSGLWVQGIDLGFVLDF